MTTNKNINDDNFAIHSDADSVIVYHEKCYDGFGAAWAAYQKFGDDADYIASPTAIDFADNPGVTQEFNEHDVVFVDMCPSENTLRKLEVVAESVTVIDHHKSEKELVESVDNHVYDVNHSGAVLAWKHFIGGDPPTLLKYVEDRDLWKFELPCSRNVSRAIHADAKTFDRWFELAFDKDPEDFVAHMADIGEHIASYQNQLVNDVMSNIEYGRFYGHEAAIVNCPLLRSEVGERIYQDTVADIAFMWRYENNKIKVSLRTGRDDIDVSEIAKQYGGGGHAPAAGFTMDPDTFFKLIGIKKAEKRVVKETDG